MLDGYKVICNTAAGRRRYMQYLVPFIVSCDVVDRYDIWINTNDKQDIEFFRQLAAKFPKINLVLQPDGVVSGLSSINAFYRSCIELDAIYFKLDDDIVWMEPGLIEKMVRFRIDNPDYFIVSPLVINNPMCTYLLCNRKKIKTDNYYSANPFSAQLWASGQFAAELHEWFLDRLTLDSYHDIHLGTQPIAMNRMSINSILWFGHQMATFDGIVPFDDEEWLCVVKPTELGLANCINGDAILAHFAFGPQREMLDQHTILEQYGEYLHQLWSRDEKMKQIDQSIQQMMIDIESRKQEIMDSADLYQITQPPAAIIGFRKRFANIVRKRYVKYIIRPRQSQQYIITSRPK